jgi:hypothetical protein
MASSQELSDFLRDVERRAFKQTVYAVRDEHTALDIVQDSMLKLAEKYADIICLDMFSDAFEKLKLKNFSKPLYAVTPRIMFDSDIEKIIETIE